MAGSLEALAQLPNSTLWICLAALLIALLLGWLFGRISSIRKITTLQAMVEYEVRHSEQQIQQLSDHFSTLSSRALRDNNDLFLDLAQSNFHQLLNQSDHQLQQRQQAINNLVEPIKQGLKQAHEQIRAFDDSRRQAHGELNQHLGSITQGQQQLNQETRNLVNALRRPELRGRWGEQTLQRLVELAGMVEHVDFVQQASVRNEDGLHRPDMVIQLPGGRQVVVDAKTPMDAYLDAIGCDDDSQRLTLLKRHAQQCKQRVDELAAKRYWAQFAQSPEFVVLFIPGDQFLASALEQKSELLEYALHKRVILATPTSLVALLHTIAYGWKQDKLNHHALAIRELAEQYQKRLLRFNQHVVDLGSKLNQSVDGFNALVGSYQHSILPIAKRFADSGVGKQAEVTSPQNINTSTRVSQVSSEDLDEDSDKDLDGELDRGLNAALHQQANELKDKPDGISADASVTHNTANTPPKQTNQGVASASQSDQPFSKSPL